MRFESKTLKQNFFLLVFVLTSTTINAQTSLSFDGVNDHIIGSMPGPSGTSDRTIECWVKTTNPATTQKVLVDWGSPSPLGSRFTLNMLGGGKLRIEVGGNGFNSTRLINDGLWHHVAVTYNHQATTKASLYIDGLLELGSNFTQSVNTSTLNPILIGRRVDSINFFEGLIDEVRVWNVARTQAQISANMNTSFCNMPSNLVTYYKLDDGIANGNNQTNNVAFDATTNSNNGRLTNFNLNGSNSNWVSSNIPIQSELNDSIYQNGNSLFVIDTSADSYQWFDCSNLTFNLTDTGRIFSPQANGIYALSIQKGRCLDTSNCINFVSTSIAEIEENLNYLLKNNPSEDIVTIQFINFPQQQSIVSIYEMSGKLIGKETVSGSDEVIFRNLNNSGIYIINILNDKNQLKSIKILKD